MKEAMKKENKENKINLRDLDDISCSNVVISRQIKRMIRKFPSMNKLSISCWIHGGHYTLFQYKGDRFVWSTDPNSKCIKGCESLTDKSDEIDKWELNKLVAFTYKAMIDSQSNVDLVDTPEDLLAYADTKLQEIIREDNTIYAQD